MKALLNRIQKCRICENVLPHEPRPVLSLNKNSRILIIGQAPGRIVHNTKIAWNDASGKELRRWLGVNEEQFYNKDLFGSLPMGFCYPGKGKSGDLPPRKECAPAWHKLVLSKMPNVELTLLIGAYSQGYYLDKKETLTSRVMRFEEYMPKYLPLPHPSPRNRLWQRRNPWFEDAVVPMLQNKVKEILDL